MHQCRLSMTTSGVVKSTTTSAPASATRTASRPGRPSPTSSRSSAASTARHTSAPIRPRAPSTPTRIGSALVSHVAQPIPIGTVPAGSPLTDRYAAQATRRSAQKSWSPNGPTTASDIGRPSSSAATSRTSAGGHRVDPGEQLVHRQQLAVEQLALAQPAHPRAGVLQAEHERALDHALAPGHLVLGEAVGGHPGQLGAGQRRAPRRPCRARSRRRRANRPVSAYCAAYE